MLYHRNNRVVARRRKHNGKKWGCWVDVVIWKPSFRWRLPRGGSLRLIPNAVSDVQAIREELLECDYFRQYKIQGEKEPRAHFLLHERATASENKKQPLYRYEDEEECTDVASRLTPTQATDPRQCVQDP